MTTYSLEARNTRPISWLKAARKDFEAFPQGAQTAILRALTVAPLLGEAIRRIHENSSVSSLFV